MLRSVLSARCPIRRSCFRSNRNISTALFLRGFPDETTALEVKAILEDYGTVLSVHMLHKGLLSNTNSKSERKDKVALVHFDSISSAIKCYEAYVHECLRGRRLSVEYCTKAPFSADLRDIAYRASVDCFGRWAGRSPLIRKTN